MSKLKIKFNVFEKRLVMQVIEQDKSLIGSASKPISFMASNGIMIQSSLRPGVYNNLNTIALRGSDSKEDLAISYGIFNSTDEAKEFMLKVNSAINEFLNQVKYKAVEEYSLEIGNEIQLPDCTVLFSILSGGFMMQLIRSDIKNQLFVSNGSLSVEIVNKSIVGVTLPFKSDSITQIFVPLKDYSRKDICKVIKSIIEKLYFNSQGLTNIQVMSLDNNPYPEFIYDVE